MATIRVQNYEIEPTEWSVDLYRIMVSGPKSKVPGTEYRQPIAYYQDYAGAGKRLLDVLQNHSDASDIKALIAATEEAKKQIVAACKKVVTIE